MFSSRFMLLPTFTIFYFFLEKHFFSFHFAFYAIFNITKQNIEILKSAPSLTG